MAWRDLQGELSDIFSAYAGHFDRYGGSQLHVRRFNTNEYMAAWRAANPGKHAAYQRAYVARNREAIYARQNAWARAKRAASAAERARHGVG